MRVVVSEMVALALPTSDGVHTQQNSHERPAACGPSVYSRAHRWSALLRRHAPAM